jgi:hypothetical protein
MPVGLQVLGRPQGEETVLALMAAVQAANQIGAPPMVFRAGAHQRRHLLEQVQGSCERGRCEPTELPRQAITIDCTSWSSAMNPSRF